MKAQIVSFHCVLKDKVGKVISSTFNHEVITQTEGSSPEILRGLADGLRDLKKGERRLINLSADQAYGFYDLKLVMKVPRKQLTQNKEIHTGQEIVAQAEDGEVKVFRVIEMTGTTVTLDGNHPLAGQDLVFEIEATEARDATSDEIEESKLSSTSRLLLH